MFYILVAILVTLRSRSNLGRARLFSILVSVLVTLRSRSNLGRARLFGMLVTIRVALSGRGTLEPGGSLGQGCGSIRTPQCRPIWGQSHWVNRNLHWGISAGILRSRIA